MCISSIVPETGTLRLIRFDEGNGTMLLALVLFEVAPHVSTVQVRMTTAIPMSCILADHDNRFFWLVVCPSAVSAFGL